MLFEILLSSCLNEPCSVAKGTTLLASSADTTRDLSVLESESEGRGVMSLKSNVLKNSKSIGSPSVALASRIFLNSSSISSSRSRSPNGSPSSNNKLPSQLSSVLFDVLF